MTTYVVHVDQRVHYRYENDAESPEALVEQMSTGVWDDSDNEVVEEEVRVYLSTDDPELDDPLYVHTTS